MKQLIYTILTVLFLSGCSYKKHMIYLNDVDSKAISKIEPGVFENIIQSGDILKIEVQSIIPEASIPYNKPQHTNNVNKNIESLKLEGYLVDDKSMITIPVLGKINTKSLTINKLEDYITKLLLLGNHLINPTVSVRRLNSKFTVLGEVRSPGTFSYLDDRINIFQAIGYAGDLTISGKRKDITLIRELNEDKKVYKINLRNSDLLNKPYYYIKNNDVIIINPNYSKIKSAGFIGSPSSIASISSLLLSVTLLIINK